MTDHAAGLVPCYGCRVEPGQPHGEHCDHAHCPDCAEQLIYHDCLFWPDNAEGPNRPSIWHGMSPTDEVARAMGWWNTVVGIDHLVEDESAVHVAEARGLISWNRDTQRYDYPDKPIPAPEFNRGY